MWKSLLCALYKSKPQMFKNFRVTPGLNRVSSYTARRFRLRLRITIRYEYIHAYFLWVCCLVCVLVETLRGADPLCTQSYSTEKIRMSRSGGLIQCSKIGKHDDHYRRTQLRFIMWRKNFIYEHSSTLFYL
jgi:hypothetical protein